LAGEHTRGGGCGSIGLNPGNLTWADGRMKVSLKGLPNKPSGGAWPSPSYQPFSGTIPYKVNFILKNNEKI